MMLINHSKYCISPKTAVLTPGGRSIEERAVVARSCAGKDEGDREGQRKRGRGEEMPKAAGVLSKRIVSVKNIISPKRPSYVGN